MAGISSKAAGKLENRYKYNGGNELQSKEFSDGSGLELYDAVHRLYDPQIGRFQQVDQLAHFNESSSAYSFVANNPLNYNDPLGLDTVNVHGTTGSTTSATNADGTQGTYVITPNNAEGTGMSGTSSVEVKSTSRKKSNESESSSTPPELGILLAAAEHKMFNKNTWFSVRQMANYRLAFNGNGYTGGKNAAKKVSRVFKYTGWAVGALNALLIMNDPKLSTEKMVIEQGANIISTFAPAPISIPFTVGWESGRWLTGKDWYKDNVRPHIQDLLGIERDEVPKWIEHLDLTPKQRP